LDQVRALADPLRLRIVEALIEDARSPKQVADLLGRKPTSLYHHVRVLEAAGLIRQTGTQRKRGTVEGYYRAVYRELRVDPALFSGGVLAGRVALLAAVLGSVDQDLRKLAKTTQPMLALHLRLEVDPARLAELEDLVRQWAGGHAAANPSSYDIAVLAYPTPVAERGPTKKPGKNVKSSRRG
jgi:DNA-binding transcriptional ArsR family regulator